MIYFIPAWYKQNEWRENEQSWYSQRTYSEFDETIKQLQLFHRNFNVDYRVLILGYSPNLRHFLHRQSLFRAEYWSVFDAISQVDRMKVAVLSYNDLNWPKGTEFVYSPFAISVFLYGKKYAKIEFGEAGNMTSIDMYENDMICRRNYYDDRGFVSCTVVFEEGKEKYKDFLGEDGKWRIRHFCEDGHVEVNKKFGKYTLNFDGKKDEYTYSNDRYTCLDDLISEILKTYIQKTDDEDKFFVALHEKHLNILDDILGEKSVISTIFENRLPLDRLDKYKHFILNSKYLITDSKEVSRIVRDKLDLLNVKDKICTIKDITPYDARFDQGISQQLKVQNILIPIDGIDNEKFEKIIVECSKYLATNKLARVHLFTRDVTWGYADKLKVKVQKIIRTNGFPIDWTIEDKQKEQAELVENEFDEEKEQEPCRFFYVQSIDERNISKCVNEQRIILDLRNVTDVFLHITAISKCVPRISSSKDEFILHKRTGYQITKLENIPNVLSYYLDSMDNWNAAMIENYELGLNYTTEDLIESWKEVLGISG